MEAQNQVNQQLEELQAQQQLEQIKRVLFLKMLSDEARDRLSNIKAANPHFAAQIEAILIQLIQSGQIRQKISESELRTIIKKIKGNNREYRIIK